MDTEAGITIIKIANGFLARDPDGILTFCVDHQAIADYVLSSAIKEKLGVNRAPRFGKPTQLDLFTKE